MIDQLITNHKNQTSQGLYNANEEHESCGVAFVASLKNKPTRKIVEQGFEALLKMDHRGAVGAEEKTGDGAGILLSMPDEFMQKVFLEENIQLPELGKYAVGIAFASQDTNSRVKEFDIFEKHAKNEGLKVLGHRLVEVNTELIGKSALSSMPYFVMFALVDQDNVLSGIDLDRVSYRVRKLTQKSCGLYFSSLSSRTITYKGMLTTDQVPQFFKDLQDEDFKSKIALVHSRFSTNTLPSWPLAQPLRNIAHNGEINTIKGNRNWFNARQGKFASPYLCGKNNGDISDLYPILTPGFSDSGSFDEALELLHLGGRDLAHAVMMMVPQAYENWRSTDKNYNKKLNDFYEYNSTLIEPWDGPASLSFTDGNIVGSVLDRNGLRPGRYWITDEIIVMASEVGVLDIDKSKIIEKGRLEPGKMLLVDTNNQRIITNDEIKEYLANKYPYGEWISQNILKFDDLTPRVHITSPSASTKLRQKVFGYTQEEINMLITPMANTGKEPVGAMGTDTPIAVLSNRPRLIFDYFTQDFAQVTNPPLDSIREKVVTSLSSAIGAEPNLLEDKCDHAKKLLIPFPVIDNDEMAKIKNINDGENVNSSFNSYTVNGLFDLKKGDGALEKRLQEIFIEVDEAIKAGVNFIILSDRNSSNFFAPIPSLLLTSAVHHHLLKNHTRTQISLMVEAGDVRETHHVALLVSFGAACVNPYLALETVENLSFSKKLIVDRQLGVKNYIKALGEGVGKIMSKMGISTIMSYRGSQIFGALGLSQKLVDKYFSGTTTKIGGINIDHIEKETLIRHAGAYPKDITTETFSSPDLKLRTGGEYKWRRTGEIHQYNPESIFYLQQSTKKNDYQLFKKFSNLVNQSDKDYGTIRSLLQFKESTESDREPIDISEVEDVSEIVKRFSTGAMSYGSISIEAHETLAKAMNLMGGRSNSGEGGEEIDRLHNQETHSRIKQVASGRFGVTSQYLVSADDIQIKLAQGAKPGEGGHLPGEKVYPWVATVRHSTPGIDLVSPPPHHDIYSIEDLAQLIHDLKMANPNARIHVKLVSEYGVGTIAAGVSKCHADVVLISGYDGGTGAAPLSSIKHAGMPWEIGLAETQQTLVQNDLRDRIVVQCDGQLKTGRDVMIAALLGAEEFGFATAPLIVEGCLMMRVCNKNTCPVGIATQDPYLRKNFKGRAEDIVTYFTFIAQEVREILAKLGFKTLKEAIGRVDILKKDESIDHYKAKDIDLDAVLYRPRNLLRSNAPLYNTQDQKHGIKNSLDVRLSSSIAFDNLSTNPQTINSQIINTDRSFGAYIGFEVTKRYDNIKESFLNDNTLNINLEGVAGQSLGAFLPKGVTINLIGEANDYVAKGLSGGKVVVKSDKGDFNPHNSIIAGNVLGFGATSGKAYFEGVVGERFAVRNSGATLICEGTGDHALEYMTGGKVMILGKTGINVGSGFLGGVAYILDLDLEKIVFNAVENNILEVSNFLDLQSDEQNEVLEMIQDYINETDSDFAKELVRDWNKNGSRISKVIPHKYKLISQVDNPAENWDSILEIVSS